MFFCRLLMLCLVCVVNAVVLAQENELDPVTISASLSPQKISKTGRNIFVIKGEMFSKLPVNSIDDLLRYLPGMEVQARGPMGAQSDFVLRGGTFQQVLVILDGVRLNDPNSGHFTSYIPISPAEIERIEILKGAASAIYGSEAVGGVVQIITKTFAAKKNGTARNLLAQVVGGGYGLFNVNAGGFTSNGTTSVGAGVLSNNATGQQQRGTKGFFNNHTASLSISHFINNNWQVALRSSYDDRRFAAQNFYTTFTSDTAAERVKTFWNQLQLIHTKDKTTTRLIAGYKALDDTYNFNSIGVPNRSKSKMWQALLTNEWKFKNQNSLTAGAQFINKNIVSNDRGNHNIKQVAGFLILNQRFAENFFLSPALRVEWNERAGWELIPQANVSYRINQLQLRASAGKTIRDADFTERFNNYNKTLVTSGRIGNPDLQAEKSFSFEGGADYFIAKNLKISASYFQRNHTDLIDYVTTPYAEMPRKINLVNTGTYALAKNISTVKTRGLEADFQYTKTWTNSKELWAGVGFVYLNSKSSSPTPSFYINSHARYLTNFAVHYKLKNFGLGVNGLYKERTPQTSTNAAIIK
ncbi:MAG: TonB-dependent receptor, partial [Bacteroidota bacterium]